MNKPTKLAQRIMVKKRWWEKLLFWKKYYRLANDAAMRSYPPYAVENRAKLYRQIDQEASVIDNIERECEIIGEFPSKDGIAIECGIKYWIVFKVDIWKKNLKS